MNEIPLGDESVGKKFLIVVFIGMKLILIKIYTAFILFGMGMYEYYKNYR